MKPHFVFEASWEVCNKVGGIYTVVKSKASLMVDKYTDKYLLVGPYFADKVQGSFLEEVPPEHFKKVFDNLTQEGIVCHFGKWIIPGQPQVILVDTHNFTYQTNDMKKKLWDDFRIDSLNTQYHDFDEPMLWSWAVGKLLERLGEALQGPIVAHFHEWLSAGGVLYLKENKNVATIFTTHATMLGRTLASHNVDIYQNLHTIDPEKEAYAHGIQSKYQTEKFAAMNADVFSTVSEITSIEAESLLGVKPGKLLPNGLDMAKFPTFEDISIKHKLYKSKIMDFIIYYFFPYYHFSLDNTLIFCLCGRYEYHDKGIDLFIDALGKLNKRLKDEGSEKTVVVFIWVPGNIRGIKPELLENKTKYQDVLESINDNLTDIKNKIVYLKLADQQTSDMIFEASVSEEIHQKILRMKRTQGTPPLCTHNLFDEDNDQIISGFRSAGLFNRKEDRVKAIFYAIYLTGADGLLDTDYYESIMGTQLGVFPSYYEPWGYTPLEAGALGVASMTTDLAGFGRYLQSKKGEEASEEMCEGIYVLSRFNKTDQEVVESLSRSLYDFTNLSKEGRIKNKLQARNLASKADWKYLIKNYFEAHEMAVKTRFGDGTS
ncbi:MAG: glycogen/starch synthase [Nanoarchaeota archaeon]